MYIRLSLCRMLRHWAAHHSCEFCTSCSGHREGAYCPETTTASLCSVLTHPCRPAGMRHCFIQPYLMHPTSCWWLEMVKNCSAAISVASLEPVLGCHRVLTETARYVAACMFNSVCKPATVTRCNWQVQLDGCMCACLLAVS